MSKNLLIRLFNGIGDKLLHLIGFYILCKHLNYNPNVVFDINGDPQRDGNNYDMRLFNFEGFTITNNNAKYDYYLASSSVSINPYVIYEFIKKFNNNITFEQISNEFVIYSKKLIKPSDIILSHIPKDIENAYGIHLRKSDKINNTDGIDIRHENTIDEFKIITDKLLEDVENIIINENDVKFLIVSDDDIWKKEITDIILNISNNHFKQIKIINIDYTIDNNYSKYNSVLDMFCLSKCKEILQGVKYSSFSLIASLLENKKLRNYSNYLDSYNICVIHLWSSIINDYTFNIENIKNLLNRCEDINIGINTNKREILVKTILHKRTR